MWAPVSNGVLPVSLAERARLGACGSHRPEPAWEESGHRESEGTSGRTVGWGQWEGEWSWLEPWTFKGVIDGGRIDHGSTDLERAFIYFMLLHRISSCLRSEPDCVINNHGRVRHIYLTKSRHSIKNVFFSIISREMSRARFYTYMGNLPEFTKETLKTFQAIMVKKT